jgi:tetratricopeptide (TPR) repeat protein
MMGAELELGAFAARLAQLLGLCVAPRWLSPEPMPSNADGGVVAVAVIVMLLAGAWQFQRSLRTRLARYAAALFWLAVAAAAAAALYFSGSRGPLGRAVPLVAPFMWAALATAAAAAADRLITRPLPHRAVLAGILCIALGGALVASAVGMLASRPRMYERAVELEPDNEIAIAALAPELVARDVVAAHATAVGCLRARPDACTCHVLRTETDLALRDVDAAITHGRTGAALCPTHVKVHAVLADALAQSGAHAEALVAADRGADLVDLGAPSHGAEPELHLARAAALEGLGRTAEARTAAERAVGVGGGRLAKLRATALAISAGDLEAADGWIIKMLADDLNDADAVYNAGLVAQKRGDYNAARERYLATLRLDPLFAVARYNLAVLTWQRGARDEAINHVKTFVEAYPYDDRGASLVAMIGAAPPGERPQRPPRP